MKLSGQITSFIAFALFCSSVRAHMHGMMKYASVRSPDGNFHLQWAYDDMTKVLYFKMKCQSTGWCGVGYADSAQSNGRAMTKYDIAVGGSRNVSDQYLYDYWSASTGHPTKDSLQNLTLLSVNETDEYTMVDFMRPANTGDMADVQFTESTTVWLMYGMQSTDASAEGMLTKHSDAGRQLISTTMKYNLIEMALAAAAPPTTAPTSAAVPVSKSGGSFAVATVTLALIARFVLCS